MIFNIILLLTPAALAQYSGMSYGMRADVSFNEYNDRFDVDAIVKDQQRAYPEPQGNEDYRRRHYRIDNRRKDSSSSSSEEESYQSQSLLSSDIKELPVKKPFVPVLDMQAPNEDVDANDFAYHDNMESGYETNYEKHLQPFQRRTRRNLLYELMNELHGGKVRGRRNMEGVDPLNEVLFHHAVPVKISIDGFVQLPQDLVE